MIVHSEPQYAETTYSTAQGTCRIRWIVSHTELNKSVIRHRSECSLPLAGQVPLISKVMSKVLEDASGATAFRTLFWGRLYPDGQPDATLAARLAVAAKRSPLWDAMRGRPRARPQDLNGFVRKLANEVLIYSELREMFQKAGLDIEVAAVEKVLVMPAGQLPFLKPLLGAEIKATDRLPYDCLTWFSILKPGSQRE